MKPLMLSAATAAACVAILSGCINTPQTKALVTPVGVIGYHTFSPPEAPPSPADIDRMTANLKHAPEEKSQN